MAIAAGAEPLAVNPLELTGAALLCLHHKTLIEVLEHRAAIGIIGGKEVMRRTIENNWLLLGDLDSVSRVLIIRLRADSISSALLK